MNKCNHFRYVIAVSLAIGLFIVINMEEHLTLTLLQLTTDYNISKDDNSSMELSLGRGIQAFQWTSYTSLLLFANIIFKWDSKVMLAIGIEGMSLCHLLIPTILPLSRPLFIIVRILQGFFYGMIFPLLLTITSLWTPIVENSTLISISLFGYWLGLGLSETIFTKLTSTNLYVPFYVFGVLGLCWTVLWSIVAKRKPSDEPKITQNEMEYNQSNGNKGGIMTLRKYIQELVSYTSSTSSHFEVIFNNSLYLGMATFVVDTIGSKKMLGITVLYPYLVAAFVTAAIALISDHLRQKCCLTKIRKTVICTGLLCSAIIIPCHLLDLTIQRIPHANFDNFQQ